MSIVILVDAISSIIKVKNIKVTLEKIEKLNNEIKEKLKEENVQYLIEQLKYKRNKTILRLYKNVYRLKKAFPAINTKEITEVLNKKVELKEIREELKQKIEKKKKKKLKKTEKNLKYCNSFVYN